MGRAPTMTETDDNNATKIPPPAPPKIAATSATVPLIAPDAHCIIKTSTTDRPYDLTKENSPPKIAKKMRRRPRSPYSHYFSGQHARSHLRWS